MNSLKLFRNLFGFLTSQRRSGTTTLLKDIASKNNVWVLVANRDSAHMFPKEKTLTIEELGQHREFELRPILVDNHTLMILADKGLLDIESLEHEVDKRNDFIFSLRNEISIFIRDNNITPNKPSI